MSYYYDLREHISALEAGDKLARIKRPLVKETELMPLVRWQFRGLPEERRKASCSKTWWTSKGTDIGATS